MNFQSIVYQPPQFLKEKLPKLSSNLPWLSLGQWPTPVEYSHELSQEINANLWIKRDDLSNPIYGGNKIRKLEPLLGDALSRGCKSLVTIGGIGSNHVIATALFGHRFGFNIYAIVIQQPLTQQVNHNIKLTNALGVNLIHCENKLAVMYALLKTMKKAKQPYFIPPGGSSPIGTLGYVAAGLELGHQIQTGIFPEPDAIFIPLGSGGTAAGLILGCRFAGIKSHIFCVRVVERILSNKLFVRLLIWRTNSYCRCFGDSLKFPKFPFSVIHTHFGGQYGLPTPESESAVKLAKNFAGLTLETTYTGKTLAALKTYCHTLGQGQNVLFWNTYNSRDTTSLLNNNF